MSIAVKLPFRLENFARLLKKVLYFFVFFAQTFAFLEKAIRKIPEKIFCNLPVSKIRVKQKSRCILVAQKKCRLPQNFRASWKNFARLLKKGLHSLIFFARTFAFREKNQKNAEKKYFSIRLFQKFLKNESPAAYSLRKKNIVREICNRFPRMYSSV